MEKYLRRCLDSLIIDEEGMKKLEVLVINDGSKDSSSQIAYEYIVKAPSITLWHCTMMTLIRYFTLESTNTHCCK